MILKQQLPAVFLDRDGVLCTEEGYIVRSEDLHIFPFVAECIERLHEAGFLTIVVSNQSAVARGMLSMDELKLMNEKLYRDTGVDKVYFCPHYEKGVISKYTKRCQCRKPNTGMIKQACADFNIDMRKSWVVGDRWSDIELARRTGVKAVLIKSELTGEREIFEDSNLISANNLEQAVDFILDGNKILLGNIEYICKKGDLSE